MDGILNHIYEFFYDWLFGTNALAVFQPIASELAMLVSVVFIGFVIAVAIGFVFGAVKLVLNMFRGY